MTNSGQFDNPEIESGEDILDWFTKLGPEKQKEMMAAIGDNFIARSSRPKRHTLTYTLDENGKVKPIEFKEIK